MSARIGFVGIGRMGANMARWLQECGHTIAAVYDVNTSTAQTLAQELGCVAAGELKAVTALSDVIFTVVSDDRAMKKIFGGGLLARARGKLFINCATISPAVQVWVEQECEARGAHSLQACMASSITRGFMPGATPNIAPAAVTSSTCAGARRVPAPASICGTSAVIRRNAATAAAVRSVNSMTSTPPSSSARTRGTASSASSTVTTATTPACSIRVRRLGERAAGSCGGDGV